MDTTATAQAQQKFSNLRRRLDQLGYQQPLGVESLPLVEKLFADLVHTTESFKNAKQQLGQKKVSHVMLFCFYLIIHYSSHSRPLCSLRLCAYHSHSQSLHSLRLRARILSYFASSGFTLAFSVVSLPGAVCFVLACCTL